MKVCLIDNMNNNFFAISRYFRDLGVDCDLYLIPDAKEDHFAPEEDTFSEVQDADWIKVFPLEYNYQSFVFKKNKILNILNSYDYIISCGLSLGLIKKYGFVADLFIPYGSDLYDVPFFRFPSISKPLSFIPKCLFNYKLSKLQRMGIKQSRFIILNSNWKIAENALRSLGRKSSNIPRLMIYLEDQHFDKTKVWDFMKNSDFLVFSPTRHLWKTNPDRRLDFDSYGGTKRNDKLIHAFARICKDALYHSPKLILFEYGNDVIHSKELISSLNISKYVTWLPIMPRKFLIQAMTHATFVADQFRDGMSATSAGTTNEALAAGVPVITNTDGSIFDPNDPYHGAPILQSLSADDIYHHFKQYSITPDYYKDLGQSGQRWFKDNLGVGLAKAYLELLQNCKSQNN
jgi:glycosyltransferase involved in cell wall biosynthesis